MTPSGRGDSVPKWGAPEWYLIIATLSSALLLLPGAQAVRMPIRALPYLCGLAMLIYWARSSWRTFLPGAIPLAALLVWMSLGLAMPGMNPAAGTAQLIFQISITAPFFFLGGIVMPPARVRRILAILFATNAAGAVVGLLQVYDPDRFMPPEFSQRGLAMNSDMLEALSYIGSNGERVIRPPGLTDLPGGAALAAAVTALLGIFFTLVEKRFVLRLAYIALAGIGFATLFLTHIRSIVLTALGASVAMLILLALRGSIAKAALIAGGTSVVLALGIAIALMLGGDSTLDRFASLAKESPGATFRANRGIFVEQTLDELLYEYPLGAGLGRWGMMRQYFIIYDSQPSEYIHAEIQITGWLLDGGIVLMLGYIILIGFLLWRIMKIALREDELGDYATLVFGYGMFTVGQSFAGPIFNFVAGGVFWLIVAAILQAAQGQDVLRQRSRRL